MKVAAGFQVRLASMAATVWVRGTYGLARTEAAGVLRADPTLLRELVERCGALGRRLAPGGNAETARQPGSVTHAPHAVTGACRTDAALHGALYATRRRSAGTTRHLSSLFAAEQGGRQRLTGVRWKQP
ncbi:hypothetical protein GCM10009549_35600 [Streptomyces thermoalcalitolerans]|uniref:Uncharacterized protein n=1 Tax=Streptomyces thermoalcalitolerans TaxID=65605 RepID=A0ABP3ZC05_9ACTN